MPCRKCLDACGVHEQMSGRVGLTFDLLTGDGRAFTLQLTAPGWSAAMPAYVCEVVWIGIPLRGGPIYGATPFQALECAILFARTLLFNDPVLGEVTQAGQPFVIDGGDRLY